MGLHFRAVQSQLGEPNGIIAHSIFQSEKHIGGALTKVQVCSIPAEPAAEDLFTSGDDGCIKQGIEGQQQPRKQRQDRELRERHATPPFLL